MATTIARVTVRPIPGGYAVTCDRGDLNELVLFRHEADELAATHQRDHVAGTPTTQHADLDGRQAAS